MIPTLPRPSVLSKLSKLSKLSQAVNGWGDWCLLIGSLLLAVSVCLGAPWLFLVGWILATAADWDATEWTAPTASTWLMQGLRQVNAGPEARAAARELLLLAYMGRTGHPDVLLVAVSFVALRVVRLPYGFLIARVLRLRRLPLLTRNIDLGPLRIPDSSAVPLKVAGARWYLGCSLAGAAGALAASGTGVRWCTAAGCAVMLAGALAWAATLLREWQRNRHAADRTRAFTHVQGWLDGYRPQTILHFSGMKGSAYQVNMWLDTMAELEGPVLLLLRERHLLDELGVTRLPVLCVPGGADLMTLDLSSARVVLYAANVGNNIHTLRLNTAKHVFIGHGDSDKSASVNPFCKVYDEIWTAGKAGTDRFARAKVSLRTQGLVEVGRPQLGEITTAAVQAADDRPVTTVLYAPTWENWSDEPGGTSLREAGENIVGQLLAAPGRVRVLYRPHPFTGLRDKQMLVTDARIREMLDRANAGHGRPVSTPEQVAAAEELVRVRRELARLVTWDRRAGADEAQSARDGIVSADVAWRISQLKARENVLFWAARPSREHRVLTSDNSRLYDCFNESDALVSDISSVVSDFVASGKPYAIADVAGFGDKEFRRRNTAARGAMILGVKAEEIGDLVAVVRGEAPDTLAEARRNLRTYLLGPDQPPALDRFKAELGRLSVRSEPGSSR